MKVYPMDRYQNVIPRAATPLHELKRVQLQDRFTLMTNDCIGHLKTPSVCVISLRGGEFLNRNTAAHDSLMTKMLCVRVWIQLNSIDKRKPQWLVTQFCSEHSDLQMRICSYTRKLKWKVNVYTYIVLEINRQKKNSIH